MDANGLVSWDNAGPRTGSKASQGDKYSGGSTICGLGAVRWPHIQMGGGHARETI